MYIIPVYPVYRVNYMCPEDCLGRGNCSEDGRCECVEGWRGQWCQVPACPNKCFDNGVCSGDGCQCEDDFTGQCILWSYMLT